MKNVFSRPLAPVVIACLLLCQGTALSQSFVGNLNGVHNASVFEVGEQNVVPTLGWVNVAGGAQVFDSIGGNGALIGQTPYGNYHVQHDTGVAIQPNTSYTLLFDMGFVAGISGGNAGYSFQLGTLNGGIFTGLGGAVSGTANYAGNLSSSTISRTDQQTFVSGSTVSGDNLAVRWRQTATAGTSDYFGFDNVKLSATVVPEPGTLGLLALGSALLVAFRRNGSRQLPGPVKP